jgi:L-ribulose-5-phosphate 4-epimerase
MLNELKREAYEANVALTKRGLTNLMFGNASALDRRKGIFAINPSGVPFSSLSPSDMVLVDLAGKKVEGEHKPSADAPTHRRLYLGFRKIGGVVHTHSLHATVFAQAGLAIPIFGTTHADYFYGDIPVTRKLTSLEIEGSYEWETGAVITERFLADNLEPLDYPGVLVNRHAPFTWGSTVAKAVEAAIAVECIAHMAIMTLELAPRLKPIEPELLDKHFGSRQGTGSYYGQDREKS